MLNISTPIEQRDIHQPSVRVSRATAHGWFVEHTDPNTEGQGAHSDHIWAQGAQAVTAHSSDYSQQ